jgi:hypothetical protein
MLIFIPKLVQAENIHENIRMARERMAHLAREWHEKFSVSSGAFLFFVVELLTENGVLLKNQYTSKIMTKK